MRYQRFRSTRSKFSRRAPKRRGLTDAQIEANRKRFAECAHTIHGRFIRDQLIAEIGDPTKVWKVMTYGIRYHEDVSLCIYGVKPARAPKEYTATVELRNAIDVIVRTGQNEPGSRGGSMRPEDQEAMPQAEKITGWQDGRPGSLASFPWLSIHEGGIIRAVRPNYDDSPNMAWVRDQKLAARLIAAIEVAPKPYHVAETHVSVRREEGK